MPSRSLLLSCQFAGCLLIALPSSGVTQEDLLQFQLDDATATSVDIDKYYRNPASLSDFPIRTLWTQRDKEFWIEQDRGMRQRIHKVVEFGAMVDGAKGVLLRCKERPVSGQAVEETFIPLPEGPAELKTTSVKRRIQTPGATAGAWMEIGRPSWCGDQVPTVRPSPPATPEPTELREWRSLDGSRSFKASLTGGDLNEFRFRLESGKSIPARLDQFSDEDQIVLLRWLEANPWPVRYPSTVSVPMSEGKGLSRVAREAALDNPGGITQPHTYQTKHFDFGSSVPLGEQHLHAVGVSFEATRRLIGALPWGIPLPTGSDARSRVQLFETRQAYRDAGGSDYSAGFYQPKSRIFFVPFESVGLLPDDRNAYKVEKSSIVYDTLHHELAHQQMHELLEYLPMWIIEGTAEFVGNLPYAEGGFRIESGPAHLRRFFAPSPLLKKLADRRPPAEEPNQSPVEYASFEEVLSEVYWPKPASRSRSGLGIIIGDEGEDPEKTRRRYNSAFLLVYFHVHLDPDRSRLPRYFASARRLALEIKGVERSAKAYQRKWIDPHNRDVVENHARVDAYNRLVSEYNAGLKSGASVSRPDKPIWAMLASAPPAFTLSGQVAAFFEADKQYGMSALTWTPPTSVSEPPAAGGAQSTTTTTPSHSFPFPSGNVIKPAMEITIAAAARSAAGPVADRRNTMPFAAVIRKNQEAAFGTPAEIAARAHAAFTKHGFPLP